MNARTPTPRCYRCGKEAEGGFCPECDEIEAARFDEAMTFNAMIVMQRITWHNFLKRLAFQVEGKRPAQSILLYGRAEWLRERAIMGQ